MSFRPQVLTVPNGGTGVSTLTNHGIVIGRGTSAVVTSTAGTAGQIMTSNGPGSDPSFQAPALSGTLDFKDSVRVATTTALPANTFGANVLTANANGALPQIDGITLTTSDRLLVKDEPNAQNNGIYTVTDLGSAGTPWILTRATDADTDAEVTNGMYMYVGEGTANGSKSFVLATHDPITLNTTALSFVVFSVAGGAPANADYVTLSLNGTLTNERVLTGTANQITITDGGAGGNVTLSTPQNIATTSSPTFAGLTLTSPLTVPSGGSGAATFTAHGVLLGNGASAFNVTTAGTSGQVLTSNGAGADPTFQTPTAGAPVGASYVTLSTDATLTSERVLTGTANRIIVTDGGAGSTVTLSTPQDIGTASTPTFGGIILSTPLAVTGGGTGVATLAAHGVLIGNGTSAVSVSGAGTAGQVLTSNGAGADPTFQNATSGLGDPGTNGMVVRTALNVTTARTLTGTANQVIITNGDGVAGAPTFSTPQSIATTSIVTWGGTIVNGRERSNVSSSAAGAYTVTTTDRFVLKTGITGGGDNVTLPNPASSSGTQITIIDVAGTAGTDNITVLPFGAETINGAANFVINTNNGAVSFITNGTNWNAY